ncbi:MAG: DUF222 domain-containing protein [Nitriliruptorales bacterium]
MSLAQGAGLLAELAEALRDMQQATAKAVDLAGKVQRARVVEIIEGLPLELLLALEHRMVSCDAHMILEAARVLERMPATKMLFAEGKLSWGQIRGIVTRLRRMQVHDLPGIDERVEASLDLVDKYSPDELVWAVEQAADEVDGARKVERGEQRTVEASFLAVQPSFDGSVRLYGELDPVAGATCLNALEAASGLPDSEPSEPGEASSRARQRAQGLVRICGDWLGGDSRRPARPLLIAHVDLADVTATSAGKVELAAPGLLPTLTAATVESLSRDADLRVVLFDGARPLAVSAKTKAAAIPSEIRLAVRARDRGCRFPGSTGPAPWADIHHVVEQADGGDHHPDKLTLLLRRWHRLVHDRKWRQRLNPETGQFTITRNGRTWHSLPRGTPLRWRPPPPASARQSWP